VNGKSSKAHKLSLKTDKRLARTLASAKLAAISYSRNKNVAVGGDSFFLPPKLLFTDRQMSELLPAAPTDWVSQPLTSLAAAPTIEPTNQPNLLLTAWRGRWLIALCVVLGLAIGWATFQQAEPRYRSSAQILVEQGIAANLEGAFTQSRSGNFLNTQGQLILSTNVLSAAVEQPELRNLASIRAAANPVGLLRSALQVGINSSNDIITVAAELPDPNDAAQIVNGVVAAYRSEYAEDRKEDVTDVLMILRREKTRCDAELVAALERLNNFRKDHAALNIKPQEGHLVTNRFAAISQELNRAEIELLNAKARARRVEAMLLDPRQHAHLFEMATADLPYLRSRVIDNQVTELEGQLTRELTRWGEGHPRVKLLRTSLADSRQSQLDLQSTIVKAYVAQVSDEADLLQHKRDELQASHDEQFRLASDVSSQVISLQSLQQEVQKAERNCQQIDEQLRELNLSKQAVEARTDSVLEPASAGEMSYPVQSKFLGAGGAIGGLLGFGLAWIRGIVNPRLRSADEIAEVLQVPVVGMVPLMPADKSRATTGQYVAQNPSSFAAELVRSMRTSIHFGWGSEHSKVIVVTSPAPGDGKSIVASNLAITSSQMGQRVLLIDADMRKPTQSSIFLTDGEFGLADVLAQRCSVADAIRATNIHRLHLLPCGKLPDDPSNLLNDGNLRELLARVGRDYDRIIIDSPPVLPVADSRILAAIADGTLLVLRAATTTRRLAVAARDELWKVHARRIGIVVNGIPAQQNRYGYQEGYEAYGYYGNESLADETSQLDYAARP
jgi:capsular exopolysaccharide synthesis family protein